MSVTRPWRLLTMPQAAEQLRKREGFTIDTQTRCFIADEQERSPLNGQGSWLSYYEAEFGRVPDGMRVRNICGHMDRGCIRPTHYEAVPEGARIPRQEPIPYAPEGLPGRLRDECEARRMTAAEFAKELRVKTSQLRSWMDGTGVPDLMVLKWVAKHLGWDGAERKWVVTFVQQRVVTARSSGEAVRQVWEEIESDSPHAVRKTAVYSVLEAGASKRR